MSLFVGVSLSLATIVLVIIAISVFIAFGGTALFYIVVVLTIVVGFINTWYISREERPAVQQKAARRTARTARKGRSRK